MTRGPALRAALVIALALGIAYFGYWACEQPAYSQTDQCSQWKNYPSAGWHWLSRDAAGFFTAVLCAITFALAWVTYGLFAATERLARDTREASAKALVASTAATKLAERNFVASHRPEIIVRSFNFVHIGAEFIGARIVFTNKGASDAVSIEIRGAIQFSSLPPDSGADMPIKVNIEKIANGAEEAFWLDSRIHIRAAELDRKEAGLQLPGHKYRPVFCIGEIAYLDRNGAIRRTGFCRMFSPSAHCWLAVENTEYEYAY